MKLNTKLKLELIIIKHVVTQVSVKFVVWLSIEVRHCLIGDHDWIHNLRCDMLSAYIVPRRPGGALPFELGLQRETASGQECEEGWPRVRSERMFILNLALHSSDPWHIYALEAEPDQTWSYNVTGNTKLDSEAMRETRKYSGRLELTAFENDY